MKVKIIKGEFKGKNGEIVKSTEAIGEKLAGGQTPQKAVTVLVEGMLHPIEMDESDVESV